MSRLRVAFITSEVSPFAKTGGLADVAGSLPSALRQLHVDIRVVMPGYRQVFEHGMHHEPVSSDLNTWLGSLRLGFHVRKLSAEHNAPIYVINREDMFDRPHLYGDRHGDYYDNAERFIFFCRAVTAWMHAWDFAPQIIHCNDWHTGLIPVYMLMDPAFSRCKTLFTVHNLGYSGLFSSDKFALTGLDSSHFQPNGLEFYGK